MSYSIYWKTKKQNVIRMQEKHYQKVDERGVDREVN